MKVYLVSKEKCVVGIFSNRTWMMEKIGHLVKDLYIQGERKRIAVTAASIGTHMPKGYLPLYDWNTEEITMRIWHLNVNNINPQFKEN